MLETSTTFPIEVDSKFEVVGGMQSVWNDSLLKNEPMFFGAGLEYCHWKAGPITSAFLANLPKDWDHTERIVIDSRVHMLMPGFWPCIPGWHHDDVPRERSDGQPNYFNPSYRSNHICAIVGSEDQNANTEFAQGECNFPDVPLGQKYYREWSPMVDEAIADGFLEPQNVNYGELIQFDDRAWHRGTQSDQFSWRLFIRASITGRKRVNEIRNQVQVYMSDPIEGW